MTSCLGLFVQDNLIKYAKISKENNNAKIENYGVKFYEQDLEKTIKQIVDETFSYKTPISINISEEKYSNAEIFGLLKEADQKKSIKTEFEYYCSDSGKNKLTLDYRTVVSEGIEDKDKKNVLYTYLEKGNIAERIQLLDSFRAINLSPVSLSLPELQPGDLGNTLIINIEDRTEVTTLINNKPVKVDVIEKGMNDVLKQIAEKENSISKAYDICKNTTLYTASGQDLQTENSEYLEIIVPTIYKIIEETKQIIEKNKIDIEKIYITGTGVIINNIDLYFQENFLDYKCEILTPYFVDKTNLRLNIKDYIEVNSAIALAMVVLNKTNKEINFSNKSEKIQKIYEILNSDVSALGKKGNKEKAQKESIKINIKDITCIRFTYSMLTIFIVYIIITLLLHNKINNKILLAQETIEDTKTKTETLAKYTTLINSRTENYQKILEQLQEANDKIAESYKSKNAVPNLLNEIMFAIPKEAQLLSIQNTNEKHITIQVQATEYQYLGYFKSEIQNRAILTNVTSTSGTRVNDMIQVTIEGDLPY